MMMNSSSDLIWKQFCRDRRLAVFRRLTSISPLIIWDQKENQDEDKDDNTTIHSLISSCFVSSSHPTNILVFVLVGFLVDALDRQFFVYWGHIVTSIFRFCWFFLSDQSPIALSLCVFSLPPWQTAGQFRQDIEPGGCNKCNNDSNADYYFHRRLASFVKIVNQENIIILIIMITMIIMMITLTVIIIIDGWPALSRSWTRRTSANTRTTTPFERYVHQIKST